MSIVYLGIGSNLGNREQNIERALEKLKSRKDIRLISMSSVIETEPVGDGGQPKFLNACCGIETTLYPDEVLNALKSIEREMGRDRDLQPKKLSSEDMLMALDMKNQDKDASEIKPGPAQDKPAWGPRVIDLDILMYDDIIMRGSRLIIPHRLMHERNFVLAPLAEIAPDAVHPVFKKSVKNLLFENTPDKTDCAQGSIPEKNSLEADNLNGEKQA
jgi:2-amino-4-hydroxy-6-hydroxymethyldihydropteridine diphosphokinase